MIFLVRPDKLQGGATDPLCNYQSFVFDVHESEHRDTIMKVTNKTQLYWLIYYS